MGTSALWLVPQGCPAFRLQEKLPFLSLHQSIIDSAPPGEGVTSQTSLNTVAPVGYSLEKRAAVDHQQPTLEDGCTNLIQEIRGGAQVGTHCAHCRGKGFLGQEMKIKAGDRAKGGKRQGCGLTLHSLPAPHHLAPDC